MLTAVILSVPLKADGSDFIITLNVDGSGFGSYMKPSLQVTVKSKSCVST